MAAAAKTRWECPNGHGAVMGPRRPRTDNIVRYCLPCSAEAGKLVKRVAPVIEAQRQRQAAAVKERRAKKQAREVEAERRRWEIDGVDTRKLMRRFCRLPAFRVWGERPLGAPRLVIVRHADSPRAQLGRAHGGYEVRINTYPGHSRWDLAETMLHELAHIWIHRCGEPGVHHGREWRDKFDEAVLQAFPGIEYKSRKVTHEHAAQVMAGIRRWARERGVEVLAGTQST